MANQVGRIRTSKYATSAKLYNKTSGALVATSTLLTTVGVDDTNKEITFDSVATGSYTLSVFIDTDVIAYDIDVDVAATTWSIVETASSLSTADVNQLRWVLGIDGTAVEPAAQGHFDLAVFTVNAIPVTIIPSGPIVRTDLDAVFGSTNITMWSDLNNTGNSGEISARVTWSINLSTSIVRGFLEGSTYKWADIAEHEVVKHLIVLKAGMLLYGPRSVSDEEGKVNPMRSHEKTFDMLVKRVYAGNFSMVGNEKQCSGLPIVVTDES